MTMSSARPDALSRFADQLTTAADAVRPTLGQLRDALARVDATGTDPGLDLPAVVEMTADVVGRDHDLATFARQVGTGFTAADAGRNMPVPADPGGGDNSDSGTELTTTTSDHGPGLGLSALRLLLSLPDVDRLVRDGNPVDAWHDKGVGYVIDWAAVVSDTAMLTCQAVHNPYVCVGGPALRGGTALLRWWASNGRIPGTDVRIHDIQAGVVGGLHHGVDAVTDIVHDGEAVVATTLDIGEHAATSATRGVEDTLRRGENAMAHLANEGSKLAQQSFHAVDRLAHGHMPGLGFGFG